MKILRLVYFFLLTFSCGELAGMKRKIKTHRCKYTFVVNEMGAADCPNSLPSLQADREAQVSIPVNPLLPLRAPERISQSSGEVKEWLSNMEKQLYDELQKTRDINSTLARHEHSLSKAEKLLTEYQSNFTTVFRMLRYLENTILTHGEISKNLDKKLSGVMLDVVEVNNVLSKKVVTPDGIIQTKNIEVQSVSKVPSCSISPESVVFRDCADVYVRHKQSGIYYVTPSYASCPIPVWCDMDTTIGGWLLILKRVSGNINFNRLWNDYKEGFGDLVDEFYLGNDNIFLLTNQKQYEVRIDLWDFSGNRVYALYKTFYIDGERDNYRLHIHNFEGSARDALKTHDRVQFSTADRDNDEYQGYNCAQEWLAGWWFNNCWFSFLTGPYYNISKVQYRGISWNDWKHEQLPHIEMKIRPSRLNIPRPDLQLTETENKSP